jgi:exosortase
MTPPTTDAPPTNATPAGAGATGNTINWALWISIGASLAALVWFFLVVPRYGPVRGQSALAWLTSAWNPETDYEHGWMFPFVIGGLIIYRFKQIRASVGDGSLWGLVVVLAGIAIYAIGYRTLQPRVTVGALPILAWGGVLYLGGWRMAAHLAFPLFFFWLAVPLPSFQQATVKLQLIATMASHHLSDLFGVATYYEGTDIFSRDGSWEPLSIAGGCSGIRSLMALLMISAAWAYVAKMAMWKRVLLFLSAFPLAILGNILRVTSIFVIAEYGDARWARETWHDWSGLLLFYPISLFSLLVLHSVLEGGLPWRKARRRELRRTRAAAVGDPTNTPNTGP